MELKKCRICGIELNDKNWCQSQKRNYNNICKLCRRKEQRETRKKKRVRETIVEHHIKYKEIHGIDETIFMSQSEHRLLHYNLRKNGKCNIPVEELQKISSMAISRTNKMKKYQKKYKEDIKHKTFNNTIDSNIYLKIIIGYNLHNDNINISTTFYTKKITN